MERKNLSVKEKMLFTAIFKEYQNKINTYIEEEGNKYKRVDKYSLLLKLSLDRDYVKINNWINLEIACLELNKEMVELAVLSNYAWKELNVDKKKDFVNKIRIFFIDKESVIFGDSPSIVKPMSDLFWHCIINNLNSQFMDSYDKIYEQYQLGKSYYLKIEKYYYDNLEISNNNKLLTNKESIEYLKKINLEFRYCYTNLHSLIDMYNKQIIKLNLDNVNQIKKEIEICKINIDKFIRLIEMLLIEN